MVNKKGHKKNFKRSDRAGNVRKRAGIEKSKNVKRIRPEDVVRADHLDDKNNQYQAPH